jgi:serine/threonine protein kinase
VVASGGRLILEVLADRGAVPGASAGCTGLELANVTGQPIRGLYTTVARLAARRLIVECGKVGKKGGRAYRLTDAGIAAIRDGLERGPYTWSVGTSAIRGEHATYELVEPFSACGRAEFVAARVLSIERPDEASGMVVGQEVLIKYLATARPPEVDSRYWKMMLRAYIGVANTALRDEFDVLRRLNHLPCAPKTYDIGERAILFGGTATRLVFLVQERIEGYRLLPYLRRQSTLAQEFRGVETAAAWFRLAEQLTRGLKSIHDVCTVHRDIRPGNIVVRSADEQPVFGDLGDAVFRKIDFVPLATEARTRPYIAPEQRGRPAVPSRAADVYALGAVLQFVATGHPPGLDGIFSDRAVKRSIVSQLAAAQGRLDKANYGVADVIARCVRVDPATRTPSAARVLQDIVLFQQVDSSLTGNRPLGANTRPSLSARIASLDTTLRRLESSNHASVMKALAASDLAVFEEHLQSMVDGALTIEGDHDEIVERMARYLGNLGAGEYFAVTVANYWQPGNLGVGGRYLSMNMELARTGLKIRRVFMLSNDDICKPETHIVLRAQAIAEAAITQAIAEDSARRAAVGGGIENRYTVLPAHDVASLVARGEHKGVWCKEDAAVEIVPVYDEKSIVRAVHIRRTDADLARAWFQGYLRDSAPLGEKWPAEPGH